MKNFTTKAAAIIHLQQIGYDQDFIMQNGQLYCIQCSELLEAGDVEVTATYRFRRNTSAKTDHTIYAIRSVQKDLKGILMTNYRAFSPSRQVKARPKAALSVA